jgi:hypothetical protein
MHSKSRKASIVFFQSRLAAKLHNEFVAAEIVARIMIINSFESWKLNPGGAL